MRLLFLLAIFFLLSAPVHANQIIDLTHPFNDKTIYWPTAKGFELNKVFWGTTKKGYFYSGNTFSAPEHGGTHLDAPIHFAKSRHTVDEIPNQQLIGRAIVIDLSARIQNQPDYLITKTDIETWEENNIKLSSDNIVFFYTGWDIFWGNKKKFLGTSKFKDTDNLHFPGLSEDAAIYLVQKKIKGVGLDTASLDSGQSKDFMAHRILLEANIYGLENVANLKKLPAHGAEVVVAPMKIEEGTGAPVRIFAILP